MFCNTNLASLNRLHSAERHDCIGSCARKRPCGHRRIVDGVIDAASPSHCRRIAIAIISRGSLQIKVWTWSTSRFIPRHVFHLSAMRPSAVAAIRAKTHTATRRLFIATIHFISPRISFRRRTLSSNRRSALISAKRNGKTERPSRT